MDQAIMQSFDLQLFADEAGAETATEPQDTTGTDGTDRTDRTSETETQGAESDTSDDTALDYSKLGHMSQDEQFAALKSAGVFGDGKPADKSQDEPQQAETTEQEETDGQAEKAPQTETEPEYEVTVDGEKVKVKQSELLSGYQRQADLT